MVTAGNIGGVMVSTLAGHASDVGSIPVLGTISPIFISPTTKVLNFQSEDSFAKISSYLSKLDRDALLKPCLHLSALVFQCCTSKIGD